MNQALVGSVVIGVIVALAAVLLGRSGRFGRPQATSGARASAGSARPSASTSGTAVLAVIGALAGGMLGWALLAASPATGWFHPATLVGAAVGSGVVLVIWRRWPAARPAA